MFTDYCDVEHAQWYLDPTRCYSPLARAQHDAVAAAMPAQVYR